MVVIVPGSVLTYDFRAIIFVLLSGWNWITVGIGYLWSKQCGCNWIHLGTKTWLADIWNINICTKINLLMSCNACSHCRLYKYWKYFEFWTFEKETKYMLQVDEIRKKSIPEIDEITENSYEIMYNFSKKESFFFLREIGNCTVICLKNRTHSSCAISRN